MALQNVAIITGASSGIGREVSLQFARRGWRVALLARRADRLAEVGEQARAEGGEALVLPTDVSLHAEVAHAMGQVEDRWGRTDVLVNNAGFGVYGLVEECEPADFERLMAVNYLGAVYCTKAVLPLMRRQGSGCIINVGSISGKFASPAVAGYCASKAALEAFSFALRLDLRRSRLSR